MAMPREDSANMSRRIFAAQATVGLAALAPLLTTSDEAKAAEKPMLGSSLQGPGHVVCVGAHPDDPEEGCGGTLARYAELGHRVTNIYLTRGEAGIAGKSHEEAAAIRTAEAEAACKILGAKAVFAGQIDAATELNSARARSFQELLSVEAPDIVLTHWPIDVHPDHQVAAMLTIRAYLACKRRFQLYFYEVCTGVETIGFYPSLYVDITATREKKRQALFLHTGEKLERFYEKYDRFTEEFRGRESGVFVAEAFVAAARNLRSADSSTLPGL